MSEEGKVPVTDKRRLAAAAPPEDAPTEDAPAEAAVTPPDYLDDLRRLQAEFENYKKRMMKEQAEITKRASARLIERLLPVLDNFERAIEHGEGGEGVALVYRELLGALQADGLKLIEAEGIAFDPRVHEAVDSVEEDGLEGPVCRTVYRRGYMLNDQVLRPAMVVVARAPEKTEA